MIKIYKNRNKNKTVKKKWRKKLIYKKMNKHKI